MPLQLVYWDIQGFGCAIRLLLTHLGVEFEEKNPSSWGQYVQWSKEAEAEGLNFPNLPWIVDGDFRISESTAIYTYILEKYGNPDLIGKTIEDRAIVRLIEGIGLDLKQELFIQIFKGGRKDAFVDLAKKGGKTDQLLKKLSLGLGDKEYFLGYLTFIDFQVAFYVWATHHVVGGQGGNSPCLRYPNLMAFYQKIYGLESIKGYIESPNFKKRPLLHPSMAPWSKYISNEL